MMDTIIHRGPDSEGKYIDNDAALGFRRLSIIDLSSIGDQPLFLILVYPLLYSFLYIKTTFSYALLL